MKARYLILVALTFTAGLALILFLVSKLLQPVLPQNANSDLLLAAAAIVGAATFLAALKDITELVERMTGRSADPSNGGTSGLPSDEEQGRVRDQTLSTDTQGVARKVRALFQIASRPDRGTAAQAERPLANIEDQALRKLRLICKDYPDPNEVFDDFLFTSGTYGQNVWPAELGVLIGNGWVEKLDGKLRITANGREACRAPESSSDTIEGQALYKLRLICKDYPDPNEIFDDFLFTSGTYGQNVWPKELSVLMEKEWVEKLDGKLRITEQGRKAVRSYKAIS